MKKNFLSVLLGLFFVVAYSKLGFAQEVDDIAETMVGSVSSLPGLIAAFSYLAGVVIAVSGIYKTIDHVTNPSQTPVRVPVIRFLMASALFSLPIIAEAAVNTINGGTATTFDPETEAYMILSGIFVSFSTIMSFGTNINGIMETAVDSVDNIPGLIAAVAYLLGLVILVSALYKTRDHVEDPTRVPLKDAVIRYITAGALFGLPTVYEAMYTTISDGGLGFGGTLSSILSTVSFFYSSESNSIECATTIIPFLGGSTLGDAICTAMINTTGFPVLLNAISYIIGLVFGVWGILKVRDHVNEPSKVALSEGISRLIAGGMFFALPYVVVIIKTSLLHPGLVLLGTVITNTTFNSSVSMLTCGTTNSLDEAMGCFMQDIMGPAHVVLNFFSFVAGMIFIMIGISRLIKSAQEGPRGPGGMGTFGTFVIGGMLLSATTILRAFSSSIFSSTITSTYATMQYTTGMSVAETQAAHNVISAVLQFMIVIGMISFVRGMFIMREVAEGKGQASVMSGVTHMVGGALAVNLGPLLNAVQETLGVAAFGVAFS